MNARDCRRSAYNLGRISIYLALLQLIASIAVECSLTTVIQSAPTATLMSTGATSPLSRRHGNTVNAVKVSTPNMAAKMSELAPALTLKSDHNAFKTTSTSMASNFAIEETEATNKNAGDTLLQKLGGMVKNAIAPTKSYVDLVNRYHKWFHAYRALQSSSKRQLRDATEVLKEEYAKVDELLMEEEAAKHASEIVGDHLKGGEDGPLKLPQPMDPKKAENMDYIFKALRIVLERLEKRLDELEKREGIPIEDDQVFASADEPEADNERVQRAMERVKKTVMNSAKNLLTGEAAIIARTAVFNGLAQFMAAKPDNGDALDHLRPIVALLGSASTPLAVSYLMSIEFRAALAIVNQANPLSLFGINLRKKPAPAK